MDQTQHICSGYLDDFRACLQCGINQINCKKCFDLKHKDDKGKKHKSQNLRQSDVYQQFQKFLNLEWLTAQFLLKGLVSFQFQRQDMKNYMTTNIFYESTFFNEIFKDDIVKYQYKLMKSLSDGQAVEFITLEHLQKILNEAQTNELILNYVSGLLLQSEQDKIMLNHLDYFNQVHISQFSSFFQRQQAFFILFIYRLTNQDNEQISSEQIKFFKSINGVFSVQNYIKWRQQIIKEQRDKVNYSKQFTAFLFDYYKKEASEKGEFKLKDYVHNFWENFHTSIQVNSHLKDFIEEEIRLYKLYEAEMKLSKKKITFLGYKIWKLNYPQTMTHLKNHYLLNLFLEGYIRMLIERTYLFFTVDEREEVEKEHWTDYVRFMKDYCLFTENEESFFDFGRYKVYYLFKKRLFGFTKVIQKDKEYPYNEQWVRRFFDNLFVNQSKKINLELYHQFVKKIQEDENKQKLELKINIEKLKEELKQEEKNKFYEFVFLNFISLCQEKELKVKKDTYFEFKKQLLETMDEKYIQETEEKFQRGDYNQPAQQAGQEDEQEKLTQTVTGFDGHKVKIVKGIDEDEERILVDNEQEGEVSQDEQAMQICLCCHGDPYNCTNQQCQIMGCCAMCCF